MVEDLQKLIEFKPITTNRQGVAELLNYVESRLKNSGLVVETFENNGFLGLYGSTTGRSHSKVLLQAHVDVVPGGVGFSREGDKIYGRGCYDMLFAVVSYLQLFESLGDASQYDIAVLLTSDEEVGGENGTGWIMQKPTYTSDVCIMPDAGEGLGTLSVGAKGMWQATAVATGKAHHASRPWEGDNAAFKLVRFLDELNDVFDIDNKEASTLTISQLQAGSDARNQGPSTAKAGVDVRFPSDEDYQRVRGALEVLCKRYDVSLQDESYGSSYTIDVADPLIQSFIKVYSAAIGRDITTHRSYGSSDARFLDEKGIPVIMVRPDGGRAHGDDEWLSLSSWTKFQGILLQYVIETSRLG